MDAVLRVQLNLPPQRDHVEQLTGFCRRRLRASRFGAQGDLCTSCVHLRAPAGLLEERGNLIEACVEDGVVYTRELGTGSEAGRLCVDRCRDEETRRRDGCEPHVMLV